MYNYGYEKRKYLKEKEREEALLRLLGFPEWKIQYLREMDDFDFNKNRSFYRHESPTEVKYFLNEPTKDFRDCVYDDTLHHNGDGLLTWAIGNAVTRQNAQEYILLDKAKSEDKIDPAAALMNAHCRAMELLGDDNGIFWCPDLD